MALQPGKPTWFGVPAAGRPLVFGLPGNPVSAVVTFSLFVAPALAALQRGPAPEPPLATALLGVDVARNPRRDQMIRVRLAEEDGATRAYPNGAQGSHILTSLLGADALALIPSGDGDVPAGATSRCTRWRAERSLSAPMACRASKTGTICAVIAPLALVACVLSAAAAIFRRQRRRRLPRAIGDRLAA